MRRWQPARLVAALGLVAAACAGPAPAPEPPTTVPDAASERVVSEPRPGFPEVEVVVTEYRFEPEVIELSLGDLVNIVVINEGDEAHDFSVEAPGIHTHPNDPIYIPAQPGERAAGELHAEATGEFQIVCTVPGHAEQGHVATLRVSG